MALNRRGWLKGLAGAVAGLFAGQGATAGGEPPAVPAGPASGEPGGATWVYAVDAHGKLVRSGDGRAAEVPAPGIPVVTFATYRGGHD